MKKTWFALGLVLAGCDEQRPPGPTPEQNKQLNEAEAMLDEERATPADAAPSNSD